MSRKRGTPDSSANSEASGNAEFYRLLARYVPAIGLMPASAAAGYLMGYGLDYLFSTTVLRFVFLVLGMISGIVQLVRVLSRDIK